MHTRRRRRPAARRIYFNGDSYGFGGGWDGPGWYPRRKSKLSRPGAVVRGPDGYLRVYYQRLGSRMQSWDEWGVAGGAKIPTAVPH